ncbi:MAG: 5'/3'-nucleotidase SurE [Candidatus Eisenbacteria bacterium]|nr:5'/3'-nucleotidase SurE [Candidatus Eisenbacteria bacterium]
MDILITNDDGIFAEGLAVLRRFLAALGHVWVVAPEREQSGASHALTLHRPLRVRRLEERVFVVDGTPTDCVLLACRGMHELSEAKIDLVVSGINHGANASEDVSYSGTVAAAIEGLMLGRPSLAISLADWRPGSFDAAGNVARSLIERIVSRGMPPGTLLNVNVPNLPIEEIRGYRMTRLGTRTYSGQVIRKTDPRGRPYYWIGVEDSIDEPQDGTDRHALRDGFVSITPIHLDLTDHESLPLLRDLGLPEEGGIG